MSYFFFEDFFAAFLAGFFAAFFFAAISYLLLHEIWTRWSCDVTGSMSATPRVSPRTLSDEDSEALAVSRNGPLSRVGSVATVVTTTSRIAIQSVVILDEAHSRQSLAKIFFEEGCGKF